MMYAIDDEYDTIPSFTRILCILSIWRKKVAIWHTGRQIEEPGADTHCMTQPLSTFPIPGVMVR